LGQLADTVSRGPSRSIGLGKAPCKEMT
jgi:hypothetical protein